MVPTQASVFLPMGHFGCRVAATILRGGCAKSISRCSRHGLPLAKKRYGGHFKSVMNDIRETDDLRVLDYNGERAFALFRLDELGSPILHEPIAAAA